jgi:hypothetical protein
MPAPSFTFLLHLGEGAETRQPDLLGRILDAVGALVALFVVLGSHASVPVKTIGLL